MVVKRSNLSSGGAVKAAAATSSSPASMSFSLDQEFLIYQSCIRHKPAGLFKHFQMAMIHNHLKSGGLIPGVTPEALWDHLSGLYNLTRCDAIERKKPKKRAVDEEDLEDEEDMEVMDENEENEENQSQEWQEFELPKVEFDFAIKDIKKGAGSDSPAVASSGSSVPSKKTSSSTASSSSMSTKDKDATKEGKDDKKDKDSEGPPPKATGKRPTRSTPGGASGKRRK